MEVVRLFSSGVFEFSTSLSKQFPDFIFLKDSLWEKRAWEIFNS